MFAKISITLVSTGIVFYSAGQQESRKYIVCLMQFFSLYVDAVVTYNKMIGSSYSVY